jgi:hypothetical protein
MCNIPYREAVDALNWAALAATCGVTYPYIVFAVATVAHFASNPGPVHWDAVERIYRYLAGTRDLWLSYGETRRTLVHQENPSFAFCAFLLLFILLSLRKVKIEKAQTA